VQIRNYAPTDLEPCRELWVHLTQWHRDIYQAPSIGGDDPGKIFDEHLAKVGNERIWLAVLEGSVVGMIGLQPGYDEGTLEIEPMVVSPEARGQGVGKALVEHVVEVVQGMGMHDLNVHVVGRNAEAIRFYHDAGFNVIGHFELFLDTRPPDKQPWREGEMIAGRSFRV
jgi:putative acetyltransferase